MAIAYPEGDSRYLWGRRVWDWTRTFDTNAAVSEALGYQNPSNYSRLVGRPLTANTARRFSAASGVSVDDLFVKVHKDDPRASAKAHRPRVTAA